LKWTPNIWVGVSVESEKYAGRIDELRKVPATVRFLSLEPLLGPLAPLDLSGIHWVLVGGESGPGARPREKAWVRDIRDQCVRENVPFVFHQWGGDQRSSTGRLLDGRAWDEYPNVA
jgi:protein gp37